jgi:hypothetical protein
MRSGILGGALMAVRSRTPPAAPLDVEPAPAAEGTDSGLSLGTDLALPLLLLAAVGGLALATRATLRSLRQE